MDINVYRLLFAVVTISVWSSNSCFPTITDHDFMLNKAFKTVTDYYNLQYDGGLVSLGKKVVPKHLRDLYESYQGRNFPLATDFANTVHNIRTEVALVNQETMFVFNLTSISSAETLIRGELHLDRKKQRKKRLLYMTLYEVAPYYVTRIVTYALDDYRQGFQYVPVTEVLQSCMAARRGKPHMFALGFSKHRKNGKMKGVHVDRFLRLYSAPLLFAYTNSSANISNDFLEPHLKPRDLKGAFVHPKTGEREEFDLDPDNELGEVTSPKAESTTATTTSKVVGSDLDAITGALATSTQAPAANSPPAFPTYDKQPIVYPAGKDLKWKIIKQRFTKDSLKTYYKNAQPHRTRRDLPVTLEGQEIPRPAKKGRKNRQRSNRVADVFERYEDADFLFDSDYSHLYQVDTHEPVPFGSDIKDNNNQYLPKPSTADNLLPLTWPSVNPEVETSSELPSKDSCGVRQFSLDFADISWADRVVAPSAIPFNYCSGACNSVPSLLRGQSNHATLQALAHTVNSPEGVPSPCCMPNGFSSATLLYLDDYGNFVLKTYPKMTVTSCGCS